MQITQASTAQPGHVNEDLVITGATWAAVLDGATAAPERPTGCRHSVVWFTRQLGSHIARFMTLTPSWRLDNLLSQAIRATMRAHQDTCDLSNPDSPSATVTLVRQHGEALDYLALADSPLLLASGGEVTVIKDDQVRHLSDYSYAGVSAARNSSGGFWVASTDPDAPQHAVTGSVPAATIDGALLLTDGASRLVEKFQTLTWQELYKQAANDGPAALIRYTREIETAHADAPQPPKGKPHDDATAVHLAQVAADLPQLVAEADAEQRLARRTADIA
ncbi:MAG: protein phosphatase 2C domain-containing protein [Nocardioidaceae bacterium]